jgi:ribosome-associated translation inhibitor RaiA
MRFQLRTDNHIKNREALAEGVRADVESAIPQHFANRLHRIEVYLQDLNSNKGGVDKRCAIEAHLDGHQPVAVSNEAASVQDAVSGALDKLLRALEHTIGRLQDRGGRVSMSGEPT